MSTEGNKQAYLKFLDALATGDIPLIEKVVDEVYSADFIQHSPTNTYPEIIKGAEGVKKFLRPMLEQAPKIKISVHDILTEGEKVISRFSFSMTSGEVTNNFTAVDIERFVNGQIVEEWELVAPGNW
jgi:predicted SnoaL-like aldol condensation-catalyzing enzyme